MHPKSAMDFLDGKDKKNYVMFYDKVVEKDWLARELPGRLI